MGELTIAIRVALLALVVLAAIFIYWLLVTTEGAYLGPKVVVLLYDWSAKEYNRLKQFDPRVEDLLLGRPLGAAMALWHEPRVLDVATGTGRLPTTLLRQEWFHGWVVGLDMSAGMLEVARQVAESTGGRLRLVRHNAATPLPFPDGTFQAVTCLEALEFMPDPPYTLAEMVRVLEGGGWLLVTNRVGIDAKFMPGKVWRGKQIKEDLHRLNCTEVIIRPWQVYYDLVWARKRS